MLGTVTLDEVIYPINRIWFEGGQINVGIDIDIPAYNRIPRPSTDYMVYGGDGELVWRGRLRLNYTLAEVAEDRLSFVIQMSIDDKLSNSARKERRI